MKLNPVFCIALVLSGLFGHEATAAIIYPPEPEGGREMVYKYAKATLQAIPGFIHGLHIDDLIIAEPYPNYYVGEELRAGRLLSAAKPGGDWVYLLMHGTNAVGLVRLLADDKTGKAVKCLDLGVDSLGADSFGNKIFEALPVAEQWPKIKMEDYEFRVLDLPWLSFTAIWLHGKSDDILIPLPPFYNRNWNANQPYKEREIINLLQPEFIRNSAMWQKIEAQDRGNKEAYSQAIMNYEQAHGGKCGVISLFGMSGPILKPAPDVWICSLQGSSSVCGKLNYQVRITFTDQRYNEVKKVEILQKLAP